MGDRRLRIDGERHHGPGGRPPDAFVGRRAAALHERRALPRWQYHRAQHHRLADDSAERGVCLLHRPKFVRHGGRGGVEDSGGQRFQPHYGGTGTGPAVCGAVRRLLQHRQQPGQRRTTDPQRHDHVHSGRHRAAGPAFGGCELPFSQRDRRFQMDADRRRHVPRELCQRIRPSGVQPADPARS